MISLVPFSAVHFDHMLAWFPTEAELVQWAGPTFDFPLDRRQLDALLAETQAISSERSAFMAVAEDGCVAGHVQMVTDRRNGIVRIARVAVAPAERGRGYGFQMLGRAVEAAFLDPDIERIELNVYTFNTPALRTYEKLGFVREGVRRSSARVGSERWDTVMMGLLRSDRPAAVSA